MNVAFVLSGGPSLDNGADSSGHAQCEVVPASTGEISDMRATAFALCLGQKSKTCTQRAAPRIVTMDNAPSRRRFAEPPGWPDGKMAKQLSDLSGSAGSSSRNLACLPCAEASRGGRIAQYDAGPVEEGS